MSELLQNKTLNFRQEVLEWLHNSSIEYRISDNIIHFAEKSLSMVLVPISNTPQMTSFSKTSTQETHDSTFFVYEDRWRGALTATQGRILAKLGHFRKIHGRLCTVVCLGNCARYGMTPDIFTAKVQRFLENWHTYGFLKKQTNYLLLYKQDIVAAAQFMHTFKPADREVSEAFEWTRYASLPDIRIVGGMGKILKRFSTDVAHQMPPTSDKARRIEIMSYSDNEWGSGEVYSKLGFHKAGHIEPITFHIEPASWKRLNSRQWEELISVISAQAKSNTEITQKLNKYAVISNLGSIKWRTILDIDS